LGIDGSSRSKKNMEKLENPSTILNLLKKHDFNFRKKFGQNFLIDGNVLDKIVDCSEITGEDCVLEIGPGVGVLTARLAKRAREVIAVEIDGALIPILSETLSDYSNVTVVNEDILKFDIRVALEEKNGGAPVKIVANLPYYITTPIMMRLLENHVPFHSMTAMVQREVAERMKAGPGSKDYGALSLAVQYYSRPEIVMYVSPGCFMPRPKVESAVIKLTAYGEKPVRTKDESHLFAVIRAAFGQRRKTLLNALANAGGLHIPKEQTAKALEKIGLQPQVRGETLTLSQFAVLSDNLL